MLWKPRKGDTSLYEFYLDGQEIKDDRPNKSTAKYGFSGDLIEITKGAKDVERYRQALDAEQYAELVDEMKYLANYLGVGM